MIETWNLTIGNGTMNATTQVMRTGIGGIEIPLPGIIILFAIIGIVLFAAFALEFHKR